jgi:hypothetical protein
MANTNPISGGPDFVRSLCNAIQKIPSSYVQPPPTGGDATSIRFPTERLALLDAIVSASDWNRNQVVNALVDKGLFVLFAELDEESASKLVAAVTGQVPPTHQISINPLRLGEIWAAILKELENAEVGPAQNVPVKAIWLRLVQQGFSQGAEISATLSWAEQSNRIRYAPGGPGGLGIIALTDEGYKELVG